MLERAEQMHHAPVHLQYLARCRVREGHLLAATELWRQIIREVPPSGASAALTAAANEANAQLPKTLPRLAKTTLRTAEDYPDLELVLDGAPLPPEVVGSAQVLDPGRHELKARARGYESWQHAWTLPEGGSDEIVITLTLGETAGAPGPEPGTGPGEPGPVPERSHVMGTAGWITASVGAGALIAGTVTLFARNSRRSDLEHDCPDRSKCDLRQNEIDDRTDSIQGFTTAANVLMFGGGALLAGGVTLIVLDKTSHSGSETAVLVGAPGSLGGLSVRGHF
jgi:hypothetical protein